MEEAALALIGQLDNPTYRAAAERAIPEAFRAPGERERPSFIQVDFAVAQDESGGAIPRLIELQAWTSLYAFQFVLPQIYKRLYDFGGLSYLLGDLDEERYLDLFRRTVLAGHAPEQVILMEIEPEKQKTRPDFLLTEKLLGIPTVGISEIIRRGKKLYYQSQGREIEIRRIYNRVVPDEFSRWGGSCAFSFRDELDVEWAGHPNGFFRISKFSLPFLDHPTVPKAWFLHQLSSYPENLDDYVLKPLFSFAGSGVKVNVTREDLDAIPEAERPNFLLQEKISYLPAIKTPDEPSKVEIRMMVLWPDDAPAPVLATTLPRMSKGKMLGVDFNKDKTWVGSSCCFFEKK